MKKIFSLLVLALVSTCMLQAQEALNLYKQNGSVKSTELVKIKSITFEDNKLVFTTSSGVFRVPLSEVDYIVFGNLNSSSIDNVVQPEVQLTMQDNLLIINSDAALTRLCLVDMTGKVVAAQKLAAVTEANVAMPASGVIVLFLETAQGYCAHKIMVK